MKYLFPVLLACLVITSAAAQQRRLLEKRGYTKTDGYYIPMDPTMDSNATEFVYLNPDNTTTIELRNVADGSLLRRDEYRGKTPVGTWMQQYDPSAPPLKTTYDIEPAGTLASCASGYLYELGSSALSFGSAGSFTAPILEGTKSINDLLRDELRYPTSSRESGAHGVVRIKGILTERGELTDLAISKSVDRDLDAEVFRIVRKLRFKSPGIVDGKPARLCITMPVTFAVE